MGDTTYMHAELGQWRKSIKLVLLLLKRSAAATFWVDDVVGDKLRLFGHICRMEDNRLVKIITWGQTTPGLVRWYLRMMHLEQHSDTRPCSRRRHNMKLSQVHWTQTRSIPWSMMVIITNNFNKVKQSRTVGLQDICIKIFRGKFPLRDMVNALYLRRAQRLCRRFPVS